MKNTLIILVAVLGCAVILSLVACNQAKHYSDLWVWVSTDLASDQELARVEGVAKTASEHGLNGMLLSAGFDALDLASPEFLNRLQHLKQTCDRLRIEIIPAGFGVGYGGAVREHDKNLAAGLPVHGALFVAGKNEAHFVPDSPPVKLSNGGFEQIQGDLPADFTLHGSRAAIDKQVHHSGKASVRFEDFAHSPGGSVYLAQTLHVQPYRSYRIHCWVKTEDVAPREVFYLWAIAQYGRDLAYLEPWMTPTSDWHELVWAFNSLEKTRLISGSASRKVRREKSGWTTLE